MHNIYICFQTQMLISNKILRVFAKTSFMSLQEILNEDEMLISHFKTDPIERVKKMSKRELDILLRRIQYLYIPDQDADTKTLISTPTQAEL